MSIAAVTAGPIGLLAAFGAGILSFLSPCVLPLVPGYISMVSGLSATEIEARAKARHRTTAANDADMHDAALLGADDGRPTSMVEAEASPVGTVGGTPTVTALAVTDLAPRADAPSTSVDAADAADTGASSALRPLLRGILLFIAGFTVVFVSLGAAASGLGHLLGAHKQTLSVAAGAVVVAMGVVLVLGALPASAWARLARGPGGRAARVLADRRFDVRPSALGSWAAPVMGMAFAFAWTPCIGPVLAAVLGLAAARATLAGGVALLLAYSLGLGVPFLVTGLAFGRLTAFLAGIRRALWMVHIVAGVVLIVFGVLLVTGQLGWLSAQFSDLLDHLGLHRLTTS